MTFAESEDESVLAGLPDPEREMAKRIAARIKKKE